MVGVVPCSIGRGWRLKEAYAGKTAMFSIPPGQRATAVEFWMGERRTAGAPGIAETQTGGFQPL
jgi:hypothetical protein